MKLVWRGRHLSPLFIIGKHTMHFTSGITFGVKYYPGNTTYYLGWLIVSKKIKWISEFVQRVNAGTWPKDWLWVIKYGK